MFDSTEICSITKSISGIPLWMAMSGMGFIILISQFLVMKDSDAAQNSYFHYSIFRFAFIKNLVRKSYFPTLIQAPSLFLLFVIISAGLFGSQRHNIATVLTWGWWWVLLIFIILVSGKAFCSICPWEALSSFATSLSPFSRAKKLGYDLKWPQFLKNLYPAIFLFIVLTWFELGFGVTRSPYLTAWFAIIMTFLAVFSALVFEKRAFCRYTCLVGRISGMYAMFSPVEMRSISSEVCKNCSGKECMNGTEYTQPCPTFLYPGGLKENTYCTLCTECIRSCPHDNLTINVRSPGRDLFQKTKFRLDEAVLALVLLSLTLFHGLTMTALWGSTVNYLRFTTGLSNSIIFTGLMFTVIAIPFFLHWLAVESAAILNPISSEKRWELFKALAYPLIPVALFYHLAHNGMHFFTEALEIIPLISDPAGLGWNLFGTKNYIPTSPANPSLIWWIQLSFICIGHVYGIITADKIFRRFSGLNISKFRILTGHVLFMILFSGLSIWLIAQPMEMRTGM